jgi:MFS family permease
MFQFIPLLQARQVPSGTIVAALTLMGPMQVVGRLFLSARGDDFSSLRVGVFAMGSLVLALLVLLLLPPSLLWLGVFAGVFGLGNGMLTIVRGTAVAEIFGRERYAEINGALAAPAVLAKAAAPLALAAIWSSARAQVSVTLTVMALVMLSSLGLLYVVRLNVGGRSPEPRRRAP